MQSKVKYQQLSGSTHKQQQNFHLTHAQYHAQDFLSSPCSCRLKKKSLVEGLLMPSFSDQNLTYNPSDSQILLVWSYKDVKSSNPLNLSEESTKETRPCQTARKLHFFRSKLTKHTKCIQEH